MTKLIRCSSAIVATLVFGSVTAQTWSPPAPEQRCPSKWGADDERGAANHRKLLWTLLMFELWHESFIETPRRIETSVSSKR